METHRRGADGRRRFSADFKREQLGRLARQEVTFSELSRELGIDPSVLRRWKYLAERGGATVVAAEAGAAAFRLWQAAQDALAATIATTMRGETGYTLRRFERERDPVSGRVIRSREWDVRSITSEPFASTSADSLAALGFARSVAGGAMYYAPDVRTLLSDAFARTHCFRPRDDVERPGVIGLAFEPVGGCHAYDGGGVLWLDRATSELREIAYRYVETPQRHESEPTSTATGELTFRPIANGAWIVSAWAVRVPVTRVASRVTPRQGEQLGATMEVDRTAVSVVRGIFEFGGAVTSVFDARDATVGALSSFGSVRGVVDDSLTHQGVASLPVVISAASATTFRTTTGTHGEFAFDSLPAGDYVLRLPAARFDTTNTLIDPVSLSIASRTQMTVSIVVPPMESGIAGLCRQVPPRSVVVHGVVRDSATGAPASGARVLAYWLEATSRNDELLKAIPHERTTVADASGRYVFCDLPDWHRFLLSATAGPRSNTAPAPAVQPTRDRIRMLDLQLHDRPIDPLQAVR